MTRLFVMAAMLVLAACGGECIKDKDTGVAGDVAGVQDTATPPEDTAIPEEDTSVAEVDTATPEDTGDSLLPFGAECTAAAQCLNGVCHEFGNGSSLCTMACQDAAGCPDGSEGAKCNNQGVCKP